MRPYFLIKTVHKAFTVVDIRIKPSPVSLKPVSLLPLPMFVMIIPAVPRIRAMIIFLLILSPGSKIKDNITTIKEFVAWIIEDLTPAMWDRPI